MLLSQAQRNCGNRVERHDGFQCRARVSSLVVLRALHSNTRTDENPVANKICDNCFLGMAFSDAFTTVGDGCIIFTDGDAGINSARISETPSLLRAGEHIATGREGFRASGWRE